MTRRHGFGKMLMASVMLLFACLIAMGSVTTRAPYDGLRSQSLNGPYLCQTPPGLVPEIFAPGVVSTAAGEGCIVFSADGRRLVFRRFGSANLILEGRETVDGWSLMNVPPPFERLDWYNGDFTLAPDGRTFFFSSRRPFDPEGSELEFPNIWLVDWTELGWGDATPLAEPIRSPIHQGYPTVTSDGTLYYFSRESIDGDGDIYEALPNEGGYAEPRNLGEPVNTDLHEVDPLVAPDGSYLIFMAYLRPDGYGGGDFYISFKEADGNWSEPVNMGEPINSPADENRPFVTLDGRYFFFTSDRVVQDERLEDLRVDLRPGNGSRDVYWVDAAVIERLRRR